MAGIFKDFNKIIPEVRIAKLGDKEIDVSKIPSRLDLELAIFRDKVVKAVKGKIEMTSEEQLNTSLGIVAKVCQVSNPEITVDWLLDNTHYEQLLEFIDFVLEPVNRLSRDKKKQVQGK